MSQFKYNFDKSIHGVLGIWTWGGRLEGTDDSTELQRQPINQTFIISNFLAFCWKGKLFGKPVTI